MEQQDVCFSTLEETVAEMPSALVFNSPSKNDLHYLLFDNIFNVSMLWIIFLYSNIGMVVLIQDCNYLLVYIYTSKPYVCDSSIRL